MNSSDVKRAMLVSGTMYAANLNYAYAKADNAADAQLIDSPTLSPYRVVVMRETVTPIQTGIYAVTFYVGTDAESWQAHHPHSRSTIYDDIMAGFTDWHVFDVCIAS